MHTHVAMMRADERDTELAVDLRIGFTEELVSILNQLQLLAGSNATALARVLLESLMIMCWPAAVTAGTSALATAQRSCSFSVTRFITFFFRRLARSRLSLEMRYRSL
jgi:hypothetical protein